MFETELTICIKMDLALNNLQRLICHIIQPTNQPTNHIHTYPYTCTYIYVTPILIKTLIDKLLPTCIYICITVSKYVHLEMKDLIASQENQ